ncbi:MAG: lipopolysaccharide kinase InaA family protein [Pseudomonadota bacterium]|nr:lipopolysaccharide kinase InaA family protein [Pseudomonadota bacterium]
MHKTRDKKFENTIQELLKLPEGLNKMALELYFVQELSDNALKQQGLDEHVISQIISGLTQSGSMYQKKKEASTDNASLGGNKSNDLLELPLAETISRSISEHAKDGSIDSLGFHIKTKGNNRYPPLKITITYNPVDKSYSLLLRQSNSSQATMHKAKEKHVGGVKKVVETLQIKLSQQGSLLVEPMVVQKARARFPITQENFNKDIVHARNQPQLEQPVATQILRTIASNKFEAGKTARRVGEIRALQPNLGKDVYHYFLLDKTEDAVKNTKIFLSFVHDVGEQLSALHKRGISHRDLKVDNVLVSLHEDQAAFTLIDIPTSHLPTDIFHKSSEISQHPGDTTPGISTYQLHERSSRAFHTNFDKVKKFLMQPMSYTYPHMLSAEKQNFCYASVDSYAFLYAMLELSQGTLDPSQSTKAINVFIHEQFIKLFDAIKDCTTQDDPKWPDDLTVGFIKDSFAEYCKKTPALASFIQTTPKASKVLQENRTTKTLREWINQKIVKRLSSESFLNFMDTLTLRGYNKSTDSRVFALKTLKQFTKDNLSLTNADALQLKEFKLALDIIKKTQMIKEKSSGYKLLNKLIAYIDALKPNERVVSPRMSTDSVDSDRSSEYSNDDPHYTIVKPRDSNPQTRALKAAFAKHVPTSRGARSPHGNRPSRHSRHSYRPPSLN